MVVFARRRQYIWRTEMMKTDEISARAEEELLCVERRELLGETALYSLRRSNGNIRVRAEYGGDYAWHTLGEDEMMAREVFSKLVEGGVTPCTLKYIADELI